jgi:RimJ/RimL family protein N-acetyltransferase
MLPTRPQSNDRRRYHGQNPPMPEPPTELPHLTDGVVRLRPWVEADVPALVAALADPGISHWVDAIPFPYTAEHGRSFVSASDGFAVVDASSGGLLGSCAAHWRSPEQGVAAVGYWTRAEARGRGVATRATRLVAQWVLGELGFDRLELHADERNLASCRVAERLGFTLDGTLRSARFNVRQGRRIDLRIYSLLKSELPGAAA